MPTAVKRFRHTAETQYGTFRADFNGRTYPYAVVYCGWANLPEATARLKAKGYVEVVT